MSTCTHCGLSARWLADGEPVCRSCAFEAARQGHRVTLEPSRPGGVRLRLVAGLPERLEAAGGDLCREAARTIRELRAYVAELEAGQTAAG